MIFCSSPQGQRWRWQDSSGSRPRTHLQGFYRIRGRRWDVADGLPGVDPSIPAPFSTAATSAIDCKEGANHAPEYRVGPSPGTWLARPAQQNAGD